MRRTIEDFRNLAGEVAIELRGMARRAVASVTSGVRAWQLSGYEGIDKEAEVFEDVEVFQGVGYAARPRSGGKPEVVVLHVGGRAGHPVVVASRDQATQVELEDDETAIYNSASVIRVKRDGSVEIRSRTGTAKRLVTWDDFANHTHLTAGTGSPVGPTKLVGGPAFTSLDGTQKLKAE